MKKILLAAAVLTLLASMAFAADSDTNTITYEVTAINEVAITGDVTLTVNAAVAGSAPTQAVDNTATYAITTNCADDAKKLTGGIDAAMDDGLTLAVTAEAPTGATSAGAVDISAAITDTSDADLVTVIDAVNESALGLGFTLDATAAAGVIASDTRTFTLTLVDSAV